VPQSGAESNDIVEMAQRVPPIFVVNNYGTHMLAKPVNSLDTVLLQACLVSTSTKPGYKATGLLPIPTDPPSWGETKMEATEEGGEITFDAKTDVAGPLFAGAVVEKDDGKGRVVVLGSAQSAFTRLLSWPDYELLKQGYPPIDRFPGTAELLLNSVFWLAHMEPMIAISPSAMEVSRIQPMSKASEVFWRNGVVLIGLPLLVVVAGALMYIRRRD
jgi:hypothetical protein